MFKYYQKVRQIGKEGWNTQRWGERICMFCKSLFFDLKNLGLTTVDSLREMTL